MSNQLNLPKSLSAKEFAEEFSKMRKEQTRGLEELKFPTFPSQDVAIEFKNFSLSYGEAPESLYNLSLQIPRNKITAIIGPSGCGKSTFLRSINRMNEEISPVKIAGELLVEGKNVYSPDVDVLQLRTQVGMIFQKPQPFPLSIYNNVIFGPKIHGIKSKAQLDEIVQKTLKDVGLWEEVEQRLNDHAYGLSGGQQQRLCIARALAVNPAILLGDEPASALDPQSTYQIEDLFLKLKEKYTIVIVTHNMQQAARISDYCIFMYSGNIIEYRKTDEMFENPHFRLTENYISGRYG